MSPESHQRVRQLFQEALERPEAEWLAFLDGACGNDADLLSAVQRLLRARSRSESFLQQDSRQVQRVGRYLVRGELGRGATGVVFDAIDPMIGRSIALKVIHLGPWSKPGQLEFTADRLFKEASSAGQLFHPGIVVVLDVGQQGDMAFIAMEKVEGPSLRSVLASGPALSTDEIFGILRQTAAALDYAHQHGVVHRDVKPENILLHHGADVKVADFGIAKVISSEHPSETGVVMGTPSYMSPEQIESRAIDGRSDQFSLAVVAYELLTGVRPFRADTLTAMVHEIVYAPRPAASKVKPALSLSVDRVLQRALSRYPQERFESCLEFIEALTLASRESSSMQPAIARPVSSPATRWKPVALSGLAAAVLALGFLVYRFKRDVPAVPPPSLAATAKPEVKVTQEAPKVNRFRADPPSIESGGSATLTWDVSGSGEVTIDQGIGKVAGTGALRVQPANSTSYALTAVGPGGSTRATVAINVQPKSSVDAARARQFYISGQEKQRAGKLPETAQLFRQAADLGNAGAMAELGEMYRGGDGIARDYSEALQWLQRAADAGSSSAMNTLGVMYALGEGVQASKEVASKWFQKATDHGNAAGMYNLGGMYENGWGVSKDLDRAMQLYRQAALMGNSQALRRLTQKPGPK